MASLLPGIARMSVLISYIILIVTISEASVTWRRVLKPTTETPARQTTAQQTIAVSPTKPTTKAPVTWKRSTISRRSTDEAENRAHAEEVNDLHSASSEKDEELEEPDKNSEVKALIPGSRPGFWFDSTRRKKPSSLLRPGTRRNSLFPTRLSTTEASTAVRATPIPIIPRTPPEVLNTVTKNVSTRLFGRNRSTKSPITFRRRLKTTAAPQQTSVSELTEMNEDEKDDVVADSPNNTEKEEDTTVNAAKPLQNIDEEYDDSAKPKIPKFNIRRRRPYNGTRLAWTKKRIIRTTTVTPVQLTTTTASTPLTEDYGKTIRKTTKFPRTRISSRGNSSFASDAIRFKIKQSTTKTNDSSTITSDKLKETSANDVLGKRNNNKSSKREEIPELNLNNENIKEKTTNIDETYGTRQSSIDSHKYKSQTTIEPFYITKEYGQVATAIPEISKNYGSEELESTSAHSADEDVPQLRKNKNIAKTIEILPRKEKKRTKTQITTEEPIITSTSEEKSQNIERDENLIEHNDASLEYTDEFLEKYTTTDSPPTTIVTEKWSEKRLVNPNSRTTTTLRPVTLPVIPTIDPSSNAYVVWSVGHGGSGWSYEKQGGKVKWSAQNSENEGDSWSVVSEEENDPSYKWTSIRNPGEKYKANSKTAENFLKDREDISPNIPITYIPKQAFKNETILNFKTNVNSPNLSYKVANSSFIDLSYPAKLMYTNNASSSTFNSLQEKQQENFASGTPPPIYPTTIEDHFKAEVDGIINQFSVATNYPYMAEIRETFNPPPIAPTNNPTTRLYEFQEYITHNIDGSQEKENVPSTIQEEQFVEVPQTNAYPDSHQGIELSDSFSPGISDKDSNINRNPAINAPYQSYQSSIPPELAKAVVKAKKWRVIGNGGNEGWSLLNEDGMLEWKIHNVDGHWRVTSAEELAKTQSQSQSASQTTDDDRPQTGFYEYIEPVPEEKPRVWTLDDDYAKWRAVSTERGIPTDKSSEESSASSEEYDYESEDFSDSSYQNDEYNDYDPNPIEDSYITNDGADERPLSENYQNQMSNYHQQPKFQNGPFSGNIEIANSRDDAVAAWKSLVAQHGHWKFSSAINDRFDPYVADKEQYNQKIVQNSDKIISTLPSNFDHNRFTDVISNKHGIENPYHEHKSEYYKENLVLRQKVRNTTNKIPPNLKELDRAFQLTGHKKYNFNGKDNLAEDYTLMPKADILQEYYGSQPESSEHTFHNYKNVQNPEKSFINADQTKYQNRKDNNFFDVEAKILRHPNTDQNPMNEKNNQREVLKPQTIKSSNERIEQKDNPPKNNYKQYNFQTLVKTNAHVNGRIPEGNVEENIATGAGQKIKDHSKLESLINKLESIHKETNGKAVLDITALLNQIKARRNITTSVVDRGISNANKHHQVVEKYNNQESEPKMQKNDFSTLANKITSGTFPETKYLPENAHQSEKKVSNGNQNTNRRNTNENQNREHSVRSKNQGLRHSGQLYKSKRRKRPTRPQNSRIDSLPINQTMLIGRISKPGGRELIRSEYMQRNTSEKTKIGLRDTESKHFPPAFTSQLNLENRRHNSLNSAKLIADMRDGLKNKPTIPKRRKRPTRKRSRKPHHPQPIVMKAETEVEDETGSKKSRKIIVIDYAGSQQKKNPVDKKDLELIIRNVKYRRSEVREDAAKN